MVREPDRPPELVLVLIDEIEEWDVADEEEEEPSGGEPTGALAGPAAVDVQKEHEAPSNEPDPLGSLDL